MNHILKRLASTVLAVCLMTSTAFAAQITPSVSHLELKDKETTISFDITLKSSTPFAGAEFGIKTSDADVALQSVAYLGEIQKESTVKTVKDGILYFGFFAADNKYAAGTYPVARLTYTYAGTAPRSISLHSSKIVTVDETTGQTVGDTSSDPFTVTITRAPAGGGTGGGGVGPILPVEPSEPTQPDPSEGEEDIFFVDVPENAWFYDSVQYVAKNHLFSGVGNDRFAPNDPMSRAMLVTVLDRLNQQMEQPVKAEKQVVFSDVLAGTWYSDAVVWAAGADIVNGVGEGRFAPNANVTREQVATILYRYAEASGRNPAASPESIRTFRDADQVSGFAVDAMGWAVSEGIFSGNSKNELMPRESASRAEVAKLLSSYLGGKPL